ncbi:MAG: LOG family protein [Planctomycetota bacterium]|nr:LOG family protein [Planctomycetota bacterium]
MSNSRYRAVKAYQNTEFLNSTDARPLRILAEYIEPETRLREMRIRDTIVVFGSARIPPRDVAEAKLAEAKAGGDAAVIAAAEKKLFISKYYEATRELSFRLTEWSKQLEGTARRFVICSGGGPGIMEAANRGASEAKGENIGLNISLPFEQNDNPYITRRLSLEFHYFFMRKFWFSYLAKAVIVMPGGFGTLDEWLEMATLIQTDKIQKKMALVLFGKEYWSQVLNFQPMIDYGTISEGDPDLFYMTDSVDEAFEYITTWLKENVLDLETGEVEPVPELEA